MIATRFLAELSSLLHRKPLMPRWDGGLNLGGGFGWLQLCATGREDLLTGQAEHDK
jgi:hypothetical protein